MGTKMSISLVRGQGNLVAWKLTTRRKGGETMTQGHITLCFLSDGTINFYPKNIKNKREVARMLVWICKQIARKPEFAYHIVELCKEVKKN